MTPPLPGRPTSGVQFTQRKRLVIEAERAALRTRVRVGVPIQESMSVLDTAEALGVHARFDPIPSMEGMYVRSAGQEQPLILISSQRPAGRQVMTCGHELGHHAFDHGTKVDKYVYDEDSEGQEKERSEPSDEEEFLATCYGAFLLMTKSAVERGILARGFNPQTLTGKQAYQVAGWLGVSYTALITHLCWGLNKISAEHAARLAKIPPKLLREQLIGYSTVGDLYTVDQAWSGRPIDMKIGDIALIDDKAGEVNWHSQNLTSPSAATLSRSDPHLILTASRPGKGILSIDGRQLRVRVARRDYSGWAEYMHLEDEEV